MLERLTLRYCPTEDRLILTVQTRGPAGAARRQLALTRRVCLQWRHVLERMLELEQEAPQAARGANARPTAPLAVPAHPPDRATPQVPAPASSNRAADLVAGVSAGRKRIDGPWALRFKLISGEQLALRLSSTGAERLLSALLLQARTGQWALPQRGPSEAAYSVPPKRALH